MFVRRTWINWCYSVFALQLINCGLRLVNKSTSCVCQISRQREHSKNDVAITPRFIQRNDYWLVTTYRFVKELSESGFHQRKRGNREIRKSMKPMETFPKTLKREMFPQFHAMERFPSETEILKWKLFKIHSDSTHRNLWKCSCFFWVSITPNYIINL